jgi:hypothetical protein
MQPKVWVQERLTQQLSPCPVTMSATQAGAGDMAEVSAAQTPERGLLQRIRLTAVEMNLRSVVGATVRVYGLTPAPPRMLPADAFAQGTAEFSRKLEVGFSPDGPSQTSSDLMLRGFTSIKSIDVLSVTFSDGSMWKPAMGVCRVVPDPFMRIGAR